MKKKVLLSLVLGLFTPALTYASEADLVIPEAIKEKNLLYWGFLITFAGFLFGLYQFLKVKKLRAHKSMLDVAEVIYQTGKTYLIQQGKFLAILFLFIGAAVAFYFGYLFTNSCLDSGRDIRFLHGSLVWYSNEYSGKLKNGFCFS